MNKIRFSVLIPVYNTGKLLRKCVNSVLNQTYQNYEIIIMDDGSTDMETIRICDEFANYDKIGVVHKKNEGLLITRGRLLEQAKGEYICHLDSDDWWDLRLLEKVNDVIEKIGSDLVLFRYRRLGARLHKYSPRLFKGGTIITDENRELIIKKLFDGNVLNSLVTKIGKKELYDTQMYLRYKVVKYGEDRLQSIPLLLNAEKIYYLNEALYYYFNNLNSITRSVVEENLWDIYYQSNLIDEFTRIQLKQYYKNNIIWKSYFCQERFVSRLISAKYYLNVQQDREKRVQYLKLLFEDDIAKDIKRELSIKDVPYKLKKYYRKFEEDILVEYLAEK